MQLIDPMQAFELINAGKAYGVDVREQDEWDAGHFAGFLFNPLSTFDLDQVPTDKPVIFVCRSGNRSGQVCEALRAVRTDLMNLDGGMKAWAQLGLPLTSINNDPEVI